MHFEYMYKVLSTQDIKRLGFNHNDIKRARACCLRRLSRGEYLVKRVCSQPSHRPLWASIQENVHNEFTEHDDNRDRVEELHASVMARYEKKNQEAADPAASASPEVFSHISAALIHGLPIAYPVTHQVEVVRSGINRRFKSIHVRGGSIPREHRGLIGGTEVTSLERTLIDVARSYNLDISVAMIDDALHRELTTKPKIISTLAQCIEKRNSKQVRLALDLADSRRESPAESIAAVRFFQHGITGMEPQTTFSDDSLHSATRVDFCHQGARLIVEVDGLGKLYLGSGVPRTELEKERRREQWLRDRDWRIVRLSWKELFEEAKFDQIRTLVHSVRRAPGQK